MMDADCARVIVEVLRTLELTISTLPEEKRKPVQQQYNLAARALGSLVETRKIDAALMKNVALMNEDPRPFPWG
jgi:phytoene/squalene synthetase